MSRESKRKYSKPDFNPQPFDSYKKFRELEFNAKEILEFHFQRISSSIYRKLLFKQKYHNPWTIEVVEFVNPTICKEFFRAIHDFHLKAGVTSQVVRDRRGKPKDYVVNFSMVEIFLHHYHRISPVKRSLKKTHLGSTAQVICDQEKTIENTV